MRVSRFVPAVTILAIGCGGSEAPEGGSTPSGERLAGSSGCLACHRIGAEGSAEPGGELTTVGARLSESEIRRALVDPPSGMPSYDRLPARDVDALAAYLSGLR
jgi:ubiquinol-cytochrome c reductase cytochrome b subunit/menaquinol-cytochrome c reductase cytochrome b/c subunit